MMLAYSSTDDNRQRFTRSIPCPICGGWDGMERGQGRRCYGYTFIHEGVRFALCTREEYGNGAKYHEGSGGYIHRLDPPTPRSGANNARGGYRGTPAGREVARYDYRDEAGALHFQVVRYAGPKDFRQGHHDAAGLWIENIQGVRRVLYRLPELLAADPHTIVFIPEGEKDVDALGALGLVATCNSMGAGKWRDEYNEHLRGRRIVILPDNDTEGANHVRKVARSLTDIAASVKVLALPGLPRKGDVSDWLTAGGTAERLVALADATDEYRDNGTPRVDDSDADTDANAWEPKITFLSGVQPERVGWLWPGYIALGKLAILDGDPGLGKSSLTLDLAARVTRNAPMPDGKRGDLAGPAGVVLLSAEDGLADTIRPRLDAARAVVDRVVALECMVKAGEERGITLADLAGIERTIIAVNARLVIIDPLMAYLGAATNSYRDQDMRRILAPLARLAQQCGVAVVVVRHFSKAQTANVLYRGGGSIGIIGAARLGLVVAPDPDDPKGPRRILAVAKNNLGIKPPAFAFHMGQADNGTARVVWEGPTEHTATMLLAASQSPADPGAGTERDEVADVLEAALAQGRRLQKDVLREVCEATGQSASTVHRARRRLKIKSEREGFGPGSQVYWQLPDTEDGKEAESYVSHTTHTSQPREGEQYGTYVTGMAERADEERSQGDEAGAWVDTIWGGKAAADG